MIKINIIVDDQDTLNLSAVDDTIMGPVPHSRVIRVLLKSIEAVCNTIDEENKEKGTPIVIASQIPPTKPI